MATDASTARLRPFVFRNFAPPEAAEDAYLVDARSDEARVVDGPVSLSDSVSRTELARLEERIEGLVLEVEATGEQGSTTTLTSIEAGRMELEHLECFAEVAAELDMPPPEDGTGSYTIRYPIILHRK